MIAKVDAELAVLRSAPFCDIQTRHDLETRNDGRVHFQWQRHDVVQDAVDPEPDAQLRLGRLDV